jgi:hypothetical protein
VADIDKQILPNFVHDWLKEIPVKAVLGQKVPAELLVNYKIFSYLLTSEKSQRGPSQANANCNDGPPDQGAISGWYRVD